jgi:adenosylcobinamide-phosphate synthase
MITMTTLQRRAACVGIGLVADRFLPELSNRWHPVAWFGTLMQRVECSTWADRRSAGVLYVALGATVGATAGVLARNPTLAIVITSAGPELRRFGAEIGDATQTHGVEAGRIAVAGLVGRDTSELDEHGIAAAVIESVAENTVDAMIAPVFWAMVAGAPGAYAYRAINTMDAMVGRRNERYERFGWAAARLDDVANYLPARLFALIVAAVRPRQANRVWSMIRRDAPAHPSPNAGVAETAAAAALGVELGGPLRYGDVTEDRPRLGSGDRPSLVHINRMNVLSNHVEALTTLALLGTYLAPRCRRRSHSRPEA